MQSDKQIELQSNEISSAQESIMVMVYDIEELRRRLEKFAIIEK